MRTLSCCWCLWLLGALLSGCKDREAIEQIAKEYPGCQEAVQCGDLFYVDCGVAVDGTSHYVDRQGKELSRCGGACWKPSTPEQRELCETQCPPPAWDCGHD